MDMMEPAIEVLRNLSKVFHMRIQSFPFMEIFLHDFFLAQKKKGRVHVFFMKF